MSNPWSTSTRDIALAPLYKTLRTLEEGGSSSDSNNPSNTSNILGSPSRDSYDPDVAINGPPKTRSKFIGKLRKADEINFARRSDPGLVGLCEENVKIVAFARKLTKIFAILSKSLETFLRADVLKTAYLNAFMANQLQWDDISHENQTRLISSTRALLTALLSLLEHQQLHSAAQELNDAIERTQIMDTTKSFADHSNNHTTSNASNNPNEKEFLYLEDLFEVLMDCTGVLEVLRLTHEPGSSSSALSTSGSSSYLQTQRLNLPEGLRSDSFDTTDR